MSKDTEKKIVGSFLNDFPTFHGYIDDKLSFENWVIKCESLFVALDITKEKQMVHIMLNRMKGPAQDVAEEYLFTKWRTGFFGQNDINWVSTFKKEFGRHPKIVGSGKSSQ